MQILGRTTHLPERALHYTSGEARERNGRRTREERSVYPTHPGEESEAGGGHQANILSCSFQGRTAAVKA